MEDKRINSQEEYELFHAIFKLPKATRIFFLVFISACLLSGIACLIAAFSSHYPYYKIRYSIPIFAPILFGVPVILSVFWIILEVMIKQNSCTVTNKRIIGTRVRGIVCRTFSFRLDHIDRAEAISCLGFRKVKFTFSKGIINISPNFYQTRDIETFILSYVYNHMEFYENLSKLIVNAKNEVDALFSLTPQNHKKTQ